MTQADIDAVVASYLQEGAELIAGARELSREEDLRDAVTFCAGSLHGGLLARGAPVEQARAAVDHFYARMQETFDCCRDAFCVGRDAPGRLQ